MENDGIGRFEDGERVEWVMDSIRRGMNDNNVVKLYQVGISFLLNELYYLPVNILHRP